VFGWFVCQRRQRFTVCLPIFYRFAVRRGIWKSGKRESEKAETDALKALKLGPTTEHLEYAEGRRNINHGQADLETGTVNSIGPVSRFIWRRSD
jgi:hypothetical protein